jgi:hypothetical protein
MAEKLRNPYAKAAGANRGSGASISAHHHSVRAFAALLERLVRGRTKSSHPDISITEKVLLSCLVIEREDLSCAHAMLSPKYVGVRSRTYLSAFRDTITDVPTATSAASAPLAHEQRN